MELLLQVTQRVLLGYTRLLGLLEQPPLKVCRPEEVALPLKDTEDLVQCLKVHRRKTPAP